MRTLFAVLLLAGTLAAQKHPITHEDVWLMKRVGAPAVSPDGKWVVTSVNQPSYEAGKTVSDLWIVPVDGSAPPRRLTNTAAPESDAVFSPDSTRIAFATKREGDETTQIYILPLNGGEATRVTTLSTGASDPKWRPDGQAILFESRVYPGAMNDEDNRRIAAERKDRKYNMRVFDSFPFRYWDHWLDDLRPHIFVQTLAEGDTARDLLAGTKLASRNRDSTADPGLRGTTWKPCGAPDGSEIVFAATTDQNRSVSGPSSVASVSRASRGRRTGSSHLRVRTAIRARCSVPTARRYTPCTAAARRQALYSLTRLVKIDWPARRVSPKPDSRMGSLRSVVAFTPDSRRVYLTAEDRGTTRFSRSRRGWSVAPGIDRKEGVYTGLAIPERAASTILVALWGSMVHPGRCGRESIRRTGSRSCSAISTRSASRRSTGSRRASSGSRRSRQEASRA